MGLLAWWSLPAAPLGISCASCFSVEHAYLSSSLRPGTSVPASPALQLLPVCEAQALPVCVQPPPRSGGKVWPFWATLAHLASRRAPPAHEMEKERNPGEGWPSPGDRPAQPSRRCCEREAASLDAESRSYDTFCHAVPSYLCGGEEDVFKYTL